MRIDHERAREAFAAYVAPYNPKNPLIALKIAHTYRVAAIAERIARASGLSPEDVDLAWLCGLLHDIGRFEQVRRWNTFRDAASTSHALLGCEVLWGPRERLGTPIDPEPGSPATPRIRDFVGDASEDELLRAAIAYHSDYRVPAELDERTRAFAELLRDADKIDILRTVETDAPETILGCDAATLLASGLSAEATRAFDERRCMRRDDRSEPVDFLVSFACFAFELAYPESRRIMLEQGYIFSLLKAPFGIAEPFEDQRTRSELARMVSELRTWLEG